MQPDLLGFSRIVTEEPDREGAGPRQRLPGYGHNDAAGLIPYPPPIASS